MPDQPLPTDPHFGFYLDRDTGDEAQLDRYPPGDDRAPVYPTRDSDYETRELERLSAENEALRDLLHRARRAWNKHIDHLFDNEMPLNTSLYGLREVFQEVETDQRLHPSPQAQLASARAALAAVFAENPVPTYVRVWLERLKDILESDE